MQSKEALRTIVRESGQTLRSISTTIGRSQNYMAATVQNDSAPKADTIAEIADACGYDLLLRKRDDGSEIIIDPRERDD